MPHSETAAVGQNGTPSSAAQVEREAMAAAGEQEDTVMTEAGEAQGAENPASMQAAQRAPTQQADGEDMDVEIKQENKTEVKLEELFDGIDSDDDEFPASSNALNGQAPGNAEHNTESALMDLLRIYYQRFFPWRYMFQWLNHSPVPANDFKHREFSLWLHNDAVLRYQSYTTSDLFRKDVLRLMPRRIEIGPVYTTDPRDRRSIRPPAVFEPISKELCFDIDLTDYDDIRTCCDKANICHKCWKFITMGIKVIDAALREDFGFNHILWVYSGRRGVHAWVCDKRARILKDNHRKAITAYLELVTGTQGGKRVNLRRPLHPHVSRSIEILKDHFQKDVLEIQDPWRSPEKAERLLQQIPDHKLREALRRKWESYPERSSSAKWSDIDALAQIDASISLDPKELLDAKQDIVIEYTYPRLDTAVSQKLNHLLKSPFVIHPGTGRVCVPIDRNNLEGFDPLNVPTMQGLVAEIDAWSEASKGSNQEVKPIQDWEKTGLKPYIEYFRSFVTALMKAEGGAGVKREREEDDVKVKVESLDF